MRKFFAVLRVSVIDAVAYRGDIFLYSLSGLAGPFSIMLVWLAVSSFSSRSPMSSSEFIQYYLLVTFVSLWSSTWAGAFIPNDIRLGKLSPHLLKPMSYFQYQLGNNLGEKLVKCIFILPAILIMAIILQPSGIHVSVLNIFIFILTLAVSLLINLLLDVSIGLTAFWLDKANALLDFFNALRYLFSGYVFPLSFLPPALLSLTYWLPFRYTLTLPLEILADNPSFSSVAVSLVAQLIWLVLAFLFYRFIWSRGIRKYSASGS